MSVVAEAGFLADISEHPADPTPRLVYADWLEENGRHEMAHAMRWMARRGKRPHNRTVYNSGRPIPDSFAWAWYPFRQSSTPWRGTEPRPPESAMLPPLVFYALSDSPFTVCRFYNDLALADLALAAALAKLRGAWEAEVPA